MPAPCPVQLPDLDRTYAMPDLLIHRMTRWALRPALTAVAGLTLAGTLWAQSASCGPAASGATCGGQGVASQGNRSGTPQGAGNPIHLITGNKVITEVDLPALPGVLGLEIVRHYNSVLSGPQTPTTVIGRGWRLSYDTELAALGRTVQILQADGTRIGFQRDAADPSLCGSSDPSQGTLRARRSPQGESFDWHWADGRVLSFDHHGKLVQIQVATGEFVTLQRDARGQLVKVTDPQGRSLVLHYPRPGDTAGFRGVATIESPVGRFSYRYGSPLPEGSSLSANDLLANLVSVVRPDVDRHTVERRYHHEDARFPTLVTGISVRGRDGFGGTVDQRIATYAYGDDGRGRLSQLGHGDNALDTVTLDRTQSGVTRLTNSQGLVTVFRHGLVAGQWRLLESRGPGCASCGPTNLRFGYDAVGRLVRETALDDDARPMRTRETDRDERGRVVEVRIVEHRPGAADTSTWIERYRYDGTGSEPLLSSRPSVVSGHEVQTHFKRNASGQVTAIIETGFSPIDAQNRPVPTGLDGRVPAKHAEQASALSRRTEMSYASINGRSVLVRIDGPLPNGPTNSPADSDVTVLGWDAQGHRLQRIEAPGQRVSELNHDVAGRITGVRGVDGLSTNRQHNARGDVIATRQQALGDPRVAAVLKSIDALGHAVEQREGWIEGEQMKTVADSRNWRAGFDLAGRPRWHANALGQMRRWSHNSEGRLLRESLASGPFEQLRAFEHNAEGRVVRVSDAHGTVWQAAAGTPTPPAAKPATQPSPMAGAPRLRVLHDDFGREVARLSADHGETIHQFDAADRLVATQDALGQQGRYEWDLRGRIVRQVLKGVHGEPVETRWDYNGSRLKSVQHPEQAEFFEHDTAGRLIARRTTVHSAAAAGGVEVSAMQHWQHDQQGRLVAQTLPDGSVLRWQRNGQGQVTAITRDRVATPWLQALLPAEVLVKDIERDLIGPSRLQMGNGFEALWLRSADGHLARVLHRPTGEGAAAQRAQASSLGGLLGLRAAQAASVAEPAIPVGWLGRPAEPEALVDDRLAWDPAGNLVRREQRGRGTQRDWRYLYDAREQLLQAWGVDVAGTEPDSISRYAYDADANRLLAEEPVATGASEGGGARFVTVQSGSHRLASIGRVGAQAADAYQADPTGLPQRHADRRLTWDATGRLASASDGVTERARYAYNHRGERVLRVVDGTPTVYLHEDRRRQAEVDRRGLLKRQWIYLADLPLVVIDHPDGATPMTSSSTWARLRRDVRVIADALTGRGDRLAYLHTNHLGAPVAATDRVGQLLWQAEYGAFGRATVRSSTGFELDLRLPGQHEDAETGLHHNDHRMYDPALGRYLTPDPLGAPDGPNPFIYVRNNPLKHVDPSGLVLFAFDGTGNSPSSQTNVRHFAEHYDDFSDYDLSAGITGMTYYRRGPGTASGQGALDSAFAYSMNQTLGEQVDAFDLYVQGNWDWHWQRINGGPRARLTITLDLVGFSRGAAMAREFANRISDLRRSPAYRDQYGECLRILQRLMALFDTVLSRNTAAYTDRPLRMAIPADVRSVFHAVAMNEHRSSFDVESIAQAPNEIGDVVAADGRPARVERGFVGAHANIGGGYMTAAGPDADQRSDLSDVALMWMVQQATEAGVAFRELGADLRVVSSPVVMDERRSLLWTGFLQRWSSRDVGFHGPDRPVQPIDQPSAPDQGSQVPARRSEVRQSNVQFVAGMTVRTAEGFIDRRNIPWTQPTQTAVGDVHLCPYLTWLTRHYRMQIDFAANSCPIPNP